MRWAILFVAIAVTVASLVVVGYDLTNPPITKGLRSLPQFASDDPIGNGLRKKCAAWGNFTPSAGTSFKAGQKFISECWIVRE